MLEGVFSVKSMTFPPSLNFCESDTWIETIVYIYINLTYCDVSIHLCIQYGCLDDCNIWDLYVHHISVQICIRFHGWLVGHIMIVVCIHDTRVAAILFQDGRHGSLQLYGVYLI